MSKRVGTSPHSEAAAALDRAGWWLSPVTLPVTGLARLLEVTELLPPLVEGRWMSTAIESVYSPAVRMLIDQSIREAVDPFLATFLPCHRSFMASMFTKGAGAPAIPMHQDLTYTDEPACRSLVAWMPLVDVETRNGAMIVVPGSHRWASGVRAMGIRGVSPLIDETPVLEQLSLTVSMPAGSLLLFDVALAHGSHSNSGTHARPSIALNVVPNGIAPSICYRNRAGGFERFDIGDDYLCEPLPFRGRPTRHSHLESFDAPEPVLEVPVNRGAASVRSAAQVR